MIVPALSAAGKPLRKLGRPPVVPQQAYQLLRDTPIVPNSASVVLNASGNGTASIGPSGVGTRWYPTMVAIQTSTGPTDPSTAQAFAGTLSGGIAFPTSQVATSNQGGGDTIGLNQAELYPGLYVIVQWSGGTAGALATLTVYGVMTSLYTQ
jgi:hypothetical protein